MSTGFRPNPSSGNDWHRRFLPVLLLLVCLTTLVASLGQIVSNRSLQLEQGKLQVGQFNDLIAEHASRSLEAVDILLRELSGDLSEIKQWRHWSPEKGFDYLATRHTRSLPQLRELAIFDEMGNQKFNSTEVQPRNVNVRDQSYFSSLERGASFAMYGPYIEKGLSRYTYVLARRLTNAQGAFSGAIYAALEPSYFQDFCWSIRPNSNFESVLTNSEGRVVASCRPMDLSQQSPLIGTLARDTLGINAIRSQFRGEEWIKAETGISGFPDLRVLTLAPESSLLVQWKRHSTDVALLTAITLLAMGSVFWLMRSRQEELQHATSLLRTLHQEDGEKLRGAALRLEQQKTESDRANAAKSRFLAAASHDLRQPLHALALFASDLQRQVRLNNTEQLPQLAQQIQSSAEILSELLDALLDLSRLDVAGISPKFRSHALGDTFQRLAGTFDRTAQVKGLALRFRDQGLYAHTDAELLERLLSNLVSNAIRYTEKGGVLVSARRRGPHILVEVRDTGIGIHREHLQSIFMEFYQINNAARESHKGLGLGLSIVDRLARALGLQLDIWSQPGKGSRFAFKLPLAENALKTAVQDTAVADEALNQDALPSVSLFGHEVALVDAETLVRDWGYPVIDCQDTQQPAILITSSTALRELAVPFPAHRTILLDQENVAAPEGCHRLTLPLRPAKLRALLRKLEGELKV